MRRAFRILFVASVATASSIASLDADAGVRTNSGNCNPVPTASPSGTTQNLPVIGGTAWWDPRVGTDPATWSGDAGTSTPNGFWTGEGNNNHQSWAGTGSILGVGAGGYLFWSGNTVETATFRGCFGVNGVAGVEGEWPL